MCGDFNNDFLVPSTHLKAMLELLDSYKIVLYIDKPTWVGRCLDNIMSNIDNDLLADVYAPFSDHLGQILEFTLPKTPVKRPVFSMSRPFDDINKQS